MSPAEKSFREELVAVLPRLRRFAVALARSADAADDLLQTALERALRGEHTFERGRRVDSWMFRIIQNTWLDGHRSTARQFVPIEEIAIPGADERNAHEARDELRKVASAFTHLPEEQRAVLALVVLEGLSYKDAAETLRIPVGTVMSRLARGRAAIASAVRSDGLRTTLKGTDHG